MKKAILVAVVYPTGEEVIRETYEKYKDIIEDSMFNIIQEN